MEFLSEYGLFLAKTVTFVVAIISIIAVAVAAGSRNQKEEKGHIEVNRINDKFDKLREIVRSAILDEKDLKEEEKQKKKQEKEEKKKAKKERKSESEVAEERKKRVYVSSFDGDVKASAVEELREVITAILSVAEKGDEVVLKLESPGGMVHSYGLAASQLARVTNKEISLTVCVDKVAASGGYMMACVANKIVAAPFAVIGSIGVMAQLPNFHKLLKKHDVDYELLTAGKYKRTLTMFGENTEEGREKFMEDLEDTHVLFKDYITEHRSVVDIEKVATGEIWYGTRALDEKLIDQIQTSDEYLFGLKDDADIYELEFVQKKSLPEKLGIAVEQSMERALGKFFQAANTRLFR